MTDEPHVCWTVSTTSHLRNLTREDLKEATYAVHYQNPPRKNDDGSTTLSMMFPALVVSFYAGEPEKIAKRVAEVLNAHWDGWRPIETAPTNGTTIDVWRDGSRETVYWGFPPHECGEMGQYCDSDWHSIKEPGWICSTFGEFVGGEHDPFTHWMPVSAGPAVDEAT